MEAPKLLTRKEDIEEFLRSRGPSFLSQEFGEKRKITIQNIEFLGPFVSGYRSFGVPCRLTVKIGKGPVLEEKTLEIWFKNYFSTVDSTGVNRRERCILEGERLYAVSRVSESPVPRVLYFQPPNLDSDSSLPIVQITYYLGGCILGKILRELEPDEKEVLKRFVNIQPVTKDELLNNLGNNREKNSLILDYLISLGFISTGNNKGDSGTNNHKLTLTRGLPETRFIYHGQYKYENDDFYKPGMIRDKLIHHGLEAIIKLQENAKKAKFNKEAMPKDPNIDNLKEEFISKLENIALKNNTLKFLRNEILDSYIEEVIAPIYESREDITIIQGDCHPGNMLVGNEDYKNPKIYLVDLYRCSKGPWFSDVVDYLTHLKLFCGLDDITSNSLRKNSLELKNLKDSLSIQKKYKLVDLDRSIFAAGSISGILRHHSNTYNQVEKFDLERRFNMYNSHIQKVSNILYHENLISKDLWKSLNLLTNYKEIDKE
ncbi:MAG: hypothetical protein QXP53_02275 [Candidatus Pacearchaeota archaeon]